MEKSLSSRSRKILFSVPTTLKKSRVFLFSWWQMFKIPNERHVPLEKNLDFWGRKFTSIGTSIGCIFWCVWNSRISMHFSVFIFFFLVRLLFLSGQIVGRRQENKLHPLLSIKIRPKIASNLIIKTGNESTGFFQKRKKAIHLSRSI